MIQNLINIKSIKLSLSHKIINVALAVIVGHNNMLLRRFSL